MYVYLFLLFPRVGYPVTFTKVDVAVEQELNDWITSVGEREGRIDIVLPNAAAFVFGTIDEVTTDMWDKVRGEDDENPVATRASWKVKEMLTRKGCERNTKAWKR